ncbi:uncharacterized protein LOC114736776 [Neltuma alba]|uniref:uncharacterized protein LOC114736776 n=1 Tax=Neltuma alba TaxID=207710 RepID=UPI0010A3AF1E|nr:uncharacterized protein LOC114736776 [Prosopis alba]
MGIVEEKSSFPLPITNSDPEIKVRSVLPVFGLLNMIISCSTTIYRAYINGDIPMVVFIVFVFFGTFLLEYWFRLYNKLSPTENSSQRHYIKIGIWLLISSIMFGFAYEVSTFMSLAASVSFFLVVLCGNSLLFYVYFIWDGEGKSTPANKAAKAEEQEKKPFLESVDKVC